MGGGTVLIPILTVFLGVSQHVAQACNLFAFLPMAALSLAVHKKEGLLQGGGSLFLIVPAVIFSVLGGIAAAYLPGEVLKRLFGAFLLFLGVKGLVSLRVTPRK